MPRRRLRVLASVVVLALVYVSLNLVPRTFGRAVAQATCVLANAAFGGRAPGHDFAMHFVPAEPQAAAADMSVDMAWTAAVYAVRIPTGARALFGINLRRSYWVPFSVFIALVLASTPWLGARSLLAQSAGVLILLVPTTFAAVMHVMGGLYEQYIVDLSEGSQAAIRFTHAVLGSPGMVYALPLLVWGALTASARTQSKRAA